ncbi:helix-turn-helix domain-containing protein [Streptomyces sp. NPDC056244]|uniref:AraC-like ligand-binding domain-containing protein n=1 Tax=Streptomyces sp. NPDC056244 TaxID=3345762 RepID=UPI0035E0F4EE
MFKRLKEELGVAGDMLVTEFSTEAVAAPERFDLFVDVTARLHMPNWLRSDDKHDFRARMSVLDLGELRISTLDYPHLEIVRTAKLIRQFDPEVYQINYFLNEEATLSHAGVDTRVRVGDLVITDSSRPLHGTVHASPGSWSQMTVQCPRALLPLPDKSVQAVLGVPLDGHGSMGGVLTRWLADLNARSAEFSPADIPTLSSVTLDLLGSVVARRLDAEGTMDPDARRRALQIRIRDYIHQRLGDPSLCPATIAAAHHISVRHLHALFAGEDTTPAAWIRRRRLERCCRDLSDPRLRTHPVHAIATRWGFTNPAHFSRLFRAAYGMAPKDYRQHTCPAA